MAVVQEIQRWYGYRVDDVYGTRLGPLVGFYCDVGDDAAVWMLVRTHRASENYHLVALTRVAVGNGRIWVPFTRKHVLDSPRVVLTRPVLPGMEAKLCRHYGIAPTRGARMAAGERRSALYAIGDKRDAGAMQAVAATTPRSRSDRRRGAPRPRPRARDAVERALMPRAAEVPEVPEAAEVPESNERRRAPAPPQERARDVIGRKVSGSAVR